MLYCPMKNNMCCFFLALIMGGIALSSCKKNSGFIRVEIAAESQVPANPQAPEFYLRFLTFLDGEIIQPERYVVSLTDSSGNSISRSFEGELEWDGAGFSGYLVPTALWNNENHLCVEVRVYEEDAVAYDVICSNWETTSLDGGPYYLIEKNDSLAVLRRNFGQFEQLWFGRGEQLGSVISLDGKKNLLWFKNPDGNVELHIDDLHPSYNSQFYAFTTGIPVAWVKLTNGMVRLRTDGYLVLCNASGYMQNGNSYYKDRIGQAPYHLPLQLWGNGEYYYVMSREIPGEKKWLHVHNLFDEEPLVSIPLEQAIHALQPLGQDRCLIYTKTNSNESMVSLFFPETGTIQNLRNIAPADTAIALGPQGFALIYPNEVKVFKSQWNQVLTVASGAYLGCSMRQSEQRLYLWDEEGFEVYDWESLNRLNRVEYSGIKGVIHGQ